MLSPRHVWALIGAGVDSLLDLRATAKDTLQALHSIARGDITLRQQVRPEYATRREEACIGVQAAGWPAAAFMRPLSQADIQLLELVAQGQSDREISAHLHLSPHTVKHRIERLREALGARNRIGLAARAGRQGFYHP